ncbi:hypothetical protein AKJ24_13240 [Corynebacterium glutamicum]|nr:hypothetical protein AKJ24_13240 [Corynebacterium glutamicum]
MAIGWELVFSRQQWRLALQMIDLMFQDWNGGDMKSGHVGYLVLRDLMFRCERKCQSTSLKIIHRIAI